MSGASLDQTNGAVRATIVAPSVDLMTPTTASPAAPPAASPAPVEQTHPCVRCGRPVPLDVAMCETCNPLGLSQPATSQVHGTVLVAIVLAVVFLAVAGKVALSGVGPFRAEVTAVTAAASGLSVTLSVHNEGTKAGATTCQVTESTKGQSGPTALVQTPRVGPGETRAFQTTLTQFGASPPPLAISCQSP